MPPSSRSAFSWLPLLPVAVGLGLSAWRFRLDDPLGGLGLGLGGMALMIVVAIRLPDSPPSP